MKTCALFQKPKERRDEDRLSEMIIGYPITDAMRIDNGYNIKLGEDYLIVITGDFAIGLLEYSGKTIN